VWKKPEQSIDEIGSDSIPLKNIVNAMLLSN
jgi:hypothetical protein